MRIAVVTETWAPCVDGVVVRLENTVRHLRAAGHEVLVVAPTVGSRVAGVREARTRSIRLGFLYGGRPWGLPDLRVRRYLDEFGPDLVHVVDPVLMGSAAAWSARNRYPVVASYHTDVAAYAGHYRLGWLRGPLRSLMRRTYGRATVRLATSELGRARLADLGAGDVELWSRGVDRTLFRPDRDGSAMRRRLTPHPEEALVVYVGRLASEKGCDRLLPLLDSDLGLHVAFIGDGPDRERLEQLFGHQRATFTGFLGGDELADAYAAADALVFPSTTDTLGLVLLEAMACGVPVVAADTEAARATLAGCRDKVLVDSFEAPTLVAGVREAISMRNGPGTESLHAPTGDWRRATDELVGAYRNACYAESDRTPRRSARVGRFAAVGASNAVVDVAVFNLLLLLDPTRSPAALVAFNTCAVLAAIANSYVWNSRWTFRDRPLAKFGRRWKQRLLFLVQAGINVALNDLTLVLLSAVASWFGLRSVLATNGAKLLAMLAASAVSYLLMHHFVFPRRRPDSGTSDRDREPARAKS